MWRPGNLFLFLFRFKKACLDELIFRGISCLLFLMAYDDCVLCSFSVPLPMCLLLLSRFVKTWIKVNSGGKSKLHLFFREAESH